MTAVPERTSQPPRPPGPAALAKWAIGTYRATRRLRRLVNDGARFLCRFLLWYLGIAMLLAGFLGVLGAGGDTIDGALLLESVAVTVWLGWEWLVRVPLRALWLTGARFRHLLPKETGGET